MLVSSSLRMNPLRLRDTPPFVVFSERDSWIAVVSPDDRYLERLFIAALADDR